MDSMAEHDSGDQQHSMIAAPDGNSSSYLTSLPTELRHKVEGQLAERDCVNLARRAS